MLKETTDREEIIERVAALDIGKAELVCCVRVPGAEGKSRRVQEVTTYQTMTRALLGMVDRLTELGVARVVMEATSDYWKPPFYLLEAAGLETWLVNAKDVKHLPGRPKTDRLDEITGVGRTAACAIIAEVGVDMSRFPTPAHLASWARFAPGVKQSQPRPRATAPPGTATRSWPACSGRPPRPPAGPTPSWASATGASPAAAAPSGPSWRSAAPS